MAETKAASKSSTKKTKAKSRTAAKGSKARSSNGKAKTSKPRAKASSTASRSNGNGTAESVTAGIQSAREAVGDAGKKAGSAASKAKVPLIAGGAALVGAAGGIALNAARSNSSKVLGVKVAKPKVKIKSKDLARAADRVAGAGEQIGRLSTGIRELQGTSEGDRGNGRHRSPIEVVIQGLTRRH